MQYVRNLDGVRGLAIALVMVFHYNYFFAFGWVGVQLFFVLSGYLITTILLESKHRKLGDYLKRFYWRRTLRIFPIYYIYLALVTVWYFTFHRPVDFPMTAPWLFSYSYNLYPLFKGFKFDVFFTHFWSLCIEEQFYLLWPLLIFFLTVRQLRIVLIFFLLGAPLVRYWLGQYLLETQVPHDFIGQIIYRFTFSQWDSFAYGASIPVFGLSSRIHNPARWLAIIVIMMLIIGAINYQSLEVQGIAVSPTSLGYSIGIIENFQHVWSYSVLGFAAMATILFGLRSTGNSLADKILGNKMMVFLGKISYGLYIYHWVIWMTFNKFLMGQPALVLALGFILFIAVCIGTAYGSYMLIERPLLARRN